MKRTKVHTCSVIRRRELGHTLQQVDMDKFFREVLEDVLADVKTSPPPLPDFNDVSVRKLE